MRNGTILTLHIIPNCRLHTISFQMAHNVALCTVGTLNSSNNASPDDRPPFSHLMQVLDVLTPLKGHQTEKRAKLLQHETASLER